MHPMQTLITTAALALAAGGVFAESHTAAEGTAPGSAITDSTGAGTGTGTGNSAATATGTDGTAGTAVAPSLSSGAMDAALCDSGYARYDSNGDGRLSPDELQNASTTAFGQIDSDRDGAVTEPEYVDCVNKMAGTRAMPGDRTEANMGRYDANSDGRLTAQEFMNAANSSYDAMQEGRDRADADVVRLVFLPVGIGSDYPSGMSREDMAGRSALLFISLDMDASGDLDPAEWTEQSPALKDRSEALTEAFRRADTDRSGDLSESEYRTAQELIAANAEAAASGDDTATGTAGSGASDGTGGSGAGESGAGGSEADGSEAGHDGSAATSGTQTGTGTDTGAASQTGTQTGTGTDTGTQTGTESSTDSGSGSERIEGYEMPMNTLKPDEPAVYFTYDDVM